MVGRQSLSVGSGKRAVCDGIALVVRDDLPTGTAGFSPTY